VQIGHEPELSVGFSLVFEVEGGVGACGQWRLEELRVKQVDLNRKCNSLEVRKFKTHV
jgi:hypothetical protein